MKKILSFVLIIAAILALGLPALAASNSQVVTGPTSRIWQDGFGFHCGGAVDVEYTGSNTAVINAIKGIKKPVDKNNLMIVAKGDQKNYFGTKTYPVTLERVGDTTIWELMTNDDIVCKKCGRTDWVTYSNNSGVIDGKNIQVEHPPIGEIIKVWVDGNPEEIVALFDVYVYDKKAPDNRGAKVLDGVEAGEYVLEAGSYIVVERPNEGYLPQEDQLLVVIKGRTSFVLFCNIPEEEELNASLSFEKKVEDENIVTWLLSSRWANDTAAILAGLEFTLTGVDNSNVYGPVTPDVETGLVAFNDIVPGTYILSEEITGAAVGKFLAMEDVTLIIAEGEDKYIAIGGFVKSTGSGENISEGDFFTIVNGWGSGYTLGYPGLNNSGDIFPIAVTSGASGTVYYSFCAHGGSIAFAGQSGLGCTGYVVAAPSVMAENEPQAKDIIDFVKAYNYIEDNYGDLDDLRPVTQIVTWILLGQIDADNLDAINWAAVEAGSSGVAGVPDAKAIVIDVLANYEDYTGGGNIASVVYMICEHSHNIYNCQPQLVPVYGTFYVENVPEEVPLVGSVSFTKLLHGEATVGAGDFAFDLFKIEDGVETKIGTFETAADGVVFVNGLAPGNYVFREILGLTDLYLNVNDEFPEVNGTWGLILGPIYPNGDDGLYFEIPANGGNAVWPAGYPLDEEGNPTVNNEYFCKHSVFWSKGVYQGAFKVQIALDGGADGYINIMDPDTFAGYCGKFAIYTVFPATCTRPERISISCACGATATGYSVGDALGHDYEGAEDKGAHVMFRDGWPIKAGEVSIGCMREGCDDIYGANKPVNNTNLWEKLSGLCAVCWDAYVEAYDGVNYVVYVCTCD